MDYDDYLADLRRPISASLSDRHRFPLEVSDGAKLDKDFARMWVDRVRAYEDVLSTAVIPIKLISMYGQSVHEQEFARTLSAIANDGTRAGGAPVFQALHQYPALLATFAATLGAMVKNNYSMARAATYDALISTEWGARLPFIVTSGTQSIVDFDSWRTLGTVLCVEDDDERVLTDEEVEHVLNGKTGRRYTPISDHLHSLFAPVYSEQFASEGEYADGFDRAEVLLDAVSQDVRTQSDNFYGSYGGYGRYTWRGRRARQGAEEVMLEEARAQGNGWTPLLGGLFGGDSERAIAALEKVHEMADMVRRNQH